MRVRSVRDGAIWEVKLRGGGVRDERGRDKGVRNEGVRNEGVKNE